MSRSENETERFRHGKSFCPLRAGRRNPFGVKERRCVRGPAVSIVVAFIDFHADEVFGRLETVETTMTGQTRTCSYTRPAWGRPQNDNGLRTFRRDISVSRGRSVGRSRKDSTDGRVRDLYVFDGASEYVVPVNPFRMISIG